MTESRRVTATACVGHHGVQVFCVFCVITSRPHTDLSLSGEDSEQGAEAASMTPVSRRLPRWQMAGHRPPPFPGKALQTDQALAMEMLA